MISFLLLIVFFVVAVVVNVSFERCLSSGDLLVNGTYSFQLKECRHIKTEKLRNTKAQMP